MKCKACGETFRKGKYRIIHHFDGTMTRALVCPACVGRSVSIVTPFPRAGLTVSGIALLQKVSDRLRTQHTAARMIDQSPNQQSQVIAAHTAGRIEALAGAIELIQRAIAGVDP